MATTRSKEISTLGTDECPSNAAHLVEKEIAAIFKAESRNVAREFKNMERLLDRRWRAESS